MNRGGWLAMLAGKVMAELYPLTSARSSMKALSFFKRALSASLSDALKEYETWTIEGWEYFGFG